MKYIILTFILIINFCVIHAQRLTNNSKQAEAFISKEISNRLKAKFNTKDVFAKQLKSFSVKFELNEKAEPFNIYVSVNVVDTLIINILKDVLAKSQKIWDIEQCRKYNPSLRFLLPIHLNIFSVANKNESKIRDESPEMLDFHSLIKFDKEEGVIQISKEKFVGMTLNPIIVSNGRIFF